MLNAPSLFRMGIIACTIVASCLRAASADDTVPWVANIETARQLAAQHQRPILVHFWTEDCLPCRIVERDVFSQAQVGSALHQICVPLKVNAREFPQIAQELGVDRWPTDVLLAPDGRILGKTVSPEEPQVYVSRIMQMLGQLPGQQLPGQQLATDQAGQAVGQLASNVNAQIWPAAHQTPGASYGPPPYQDPLLPSTGAMRTNGPPPTVGPQALAAGLTTAAPYVATSGQGRQQGPSQPAFPHAPNSYGHDQPVSNNADALAATEAEPQVVDNPYARAQV
ncbi:MAG: thioredoxin family protein, partial [Planctomycetota bacterium]|nr:thioredoxin family protein [Planctomycetota bacterium]